MQRKLRVTLGLTLSLFGGSVLEAQAGFGGWGTAVYEKPAPVPEAVAAPTLSAPLTPAATRPRRSGPREHAAAVRRANAPAQVAAKDEPLAPTPATETMPSGSGAVEPAAPTIRELVTKHARANGVPDKLAAAVVSIESRFNPQARGGSALGLMQIQYATARSVGYVGGVTALLTPETNLQFGMKVLADAYKASKGDICMTLARYQSGHRVMRASAANRAYCAKARSYMARAT